jgi:hypothetical protein
MFHSQNFDKIIKNGFLNQHQTGTSGGLVGEEIPQRRAHAEDSILGLKIEKTYNAELTNPWHELRPKYAYYTLPNYSASMDAQTYTWRYGDTIAVLKRNILKRTTFSNGDSLDALHAFKIHRGESGNDVRFHSSSSVLAPETSFRSNSYYEAQVWGKITITDVDYFLVNCLGNTDNFATTEWPMLIAAKLKENGTRVPIYRCLQVDKKEGGTIYGKGEIFSVPITSSIKSGQSRSRQ